MKILAVFTGGTIGSSKVDGVISPDCRNSYRLPEMYNEVDVGVEFTSVQPYNILSENLDGERLTALCECIRSYDLENFDGVIVAHGTDTLQYTSAYLSYVFGLCKTPIVVVSANYPLEDIRSNGFENFRSAIDFIKSGEGKGVFISYTNCGDNSKIHRASRALPHSSYSDEVYSVSDDFCGEIISGKFVKNDGFSECDDEIFLADNYRLGKRSDVIFVKSYVGMVYPEISTDTKAVLLEGYHSGTLNTSGKVFIEFCRNAKQKNVPLFLTGACEGFYYESKTLFDELGIKVLPKASPIAMYMKLWLLNKGNLNDVFLPCGGDM